MGARDPPGHGGHITRCLCADAQIKSNTRTAQPSASLEPRKPLPSAFASERGARPCQQRGPTVVRSSSSKRFGTLTSSTKKNTTHLMGSGAVEASATRVYRERTTQAHHPSLPKMYKQNTLRLSPPKFERKTYTSEMMKEEALSNFVFSEGKILFNFLVT
jgi:hypothetical protein